MCVHVHLSTGHDSCLLAVFVCLSALESFLNSEDAASVRDRCGCPWRGSGQVRAPEPTQVQRDAERTLEPTEEVDALVHFNFMSER